jgi:hypothetical protein
MKSALRPTLKPLALALCLASAGTANALQFSWDNDVKMSLDTTISYGASFRAEGRDSSLIGIANNGVNGAGGTSRSVNEDDGDLNFDKGKAFANIIKATSDLEIKWRNFGFFGRGTAYYDFDLHNSDKLGPVGRERLGKDAVGLNGFIYGTFDIGGHKLRARAGRQVISWGESTFIPNGINSINPVDLAKLRVPGSELKEAFVPTAGVWGSFQFGEALSMEGFYLTNWDKIRIDPRGSYFSNNDTVSDDASRTVVSFGRRKDDHFPLSNPIPLATPGAGPVAAALYGPFDPAASVWFPRDPDRDPSDNGQYGVAFRYLAKDFNSTEFGFYFMNYHSRTPFVSGKTGTAMGGTSTLTSVVTGGPLNAAMNGSARLFAEYPEDIKLYGVSFNTAGPWGVALQGEYSYRPNQPVQYAGPEVALAVLGLPNLITGFTQIPGAPTGATAAALYPVNSYLRGWERLKMSQLQMTGTKSWPQVLDAEQLIVVGEAGWTWFHSMPTDKKFAGPGVALPSTQLGALVAAAGGLQTEGWVTDFSWGYRLAARLEYSNLLFGGNVSPRFAWSHDVRGVSPTFNQDTKSWSLGVSWDYQRKWVVDAQYTSFMGGRTYCGTDTVAASIPPSQPASWCTGANPLKDRDFYSFTISYSF